MKKTKTVVLLGFVLLLMTQKISAQQADSILFGKEYWRFKSHIEEANNWLKNRPVRIMYEATTKQNVLAYLQQIRNLAASKKIDNVYIDDVYVESPLKRTSPRTKTKREQRSVEIAVAYLKYEGDYSAITSVYQVNEIDELVWNDDLLDSYGMTFNQLLKWWIKFKKLNQQKDKGLISSEQFVILIAKKTPFLTNMAKTYSSKEYKEKPFNQSISDAWWWLADPVFQAKFQPTTKRAVKKFVQQAREALKINAELPVSPLVWKQ